MARPAPQRPASRPSSAPAPSRPSGTRLRTAKPLPAAPTPAPAPATNDTSRGPADLQALLSDLSGLLARHDPDMMSAAAATTWRALAAVMDGADLYRFAPAGTATVEAAPAPTGPLTARTVVGLVVGLEGATAEPMVSARAFDETARNLGSCALELHICTRDVQDAMVEARRWLREAIAEHGAGLHLRDVEHALERADTAFVSVLGDLSWLTSGLLGRPVPSLARGFCELTNVVEGLGGREFTFCGSADEARRAWLKSR